MKLQTKQFGFAGVVILSGLVLSTFTTGFFVSQSSLLEPSLYKQPYYNIAEFEYDALNMPYRFVCINGDLTIAARPWSINDNNMPDMCNQFGLVVLAD